MFNGGGGRRGPGDPEKSKNFGKAVKRLFGEINGKLKILFFVSIVFGFVSMFVALIAPDQMSSLTNTISDGIKPNTEALGQIQEVFESFENSPIEGPAMLTSVEIDGKTITIEDLQKLGEIYQEMQTSAVDGEIDRSVFIAKYDELPESIRELMAPKMDLDAVTGIVMFLAILYVLSAVADALSGIAMTQVTNKYAQDLRRRISLKINALPLRYFDNNQTGDILSRITNDVDTVSQSLDQSLSTIISSVVLFFGTLFMMYKTNWIMATTAVASSLIGFVFMALILSKSQKYFVMRQTELGKLNAHIEEVYSGLNVVKAYNGKAEMDRKFNHYNKRVYAAERQSQFLSSLMHPIMAFIGNFGYVAVCVVGALLTSQNIIAFGVIVAFISYVRLFTNPLTQMAQAFTNLQSAAAASERVFEFLDEDELSNEDHRTAHLDRDKVRGDIEFRNVKFGYNDDKLIIKGFNADVKAGQKIAIVGPTGAGKTTMVNLLMKFYEINDGDILIDGVSVHDLKRENIHSLFTMVLQDTWMFAGSLRENIIYNRKRVSDKRLYEICDEIGLTHFIKTLPKGLNTDIGENDSVSAGQKQLITIARGMVEDAPFLILDEATSNVDTRTEELVQSAMDKLMEGRTSFIIAHRLSTIKNADLILVMRDGNIVESGNHEQLMQQNGFYADLYNSQFAL